MKIVILSSHTPSLFWFRMDMIRAMQSQGHQVIAIGNESEEIWKDKFLKQDIEYKQIYVERTGLNPIKDIKSIGSIYTALKQVKADKVFIYQAKTIVYGSIAAKLANVKEVYLLIAGLGSIFRGSGFKNLIVKSIMKVQYKLAVSLSDKVFIQNNDDKKEFISARIAKEDKIVMLNGSGVNLDLFIPSEMAPNPTFLFIGRLIKDKGIMEYLLACKEVKRIFPQVNCLLVGPFDTNPTAITKTELQEYIDLDIIQYFGETTDVRPFLDKCSVFVLPSYHEGTPKCVLEAMAKQRAIITTDAPGCRETVINGENGFLVPIKDSKRLAEKMIWMIENPEETRMMAIKSREICVEKYDVNKVNAVIIKTMKL